MALVHEFENSGNWLFKRRSWLPVFMVVAGMVVMYLGNRQAILFDMRDELIFLGVSLFGQLIRITHRRLHTEKYIRPEHSERPAC